MITVLKRHVLTLLAASLALSSALLVLASPAAANPSPTPRPSTSTLPKLPTAPTLRLGYFANVTHAPALVGRQLLLFEGLLGKEAPPWSTPPSMPGRR